MMMITLKRLVSVDFGKYMGMLALLCLTGCAKKETVKVLEVQPNYGAVQINNTNFKTIVIGNQEWTAENFVSPISNGDIIMPGGGRYYFLDFAKTFRLPPRWRIPTIADYNKLTSSITKKADADGNLIAGPGDGAYKLTDGAWIQIPGSNSLFFNGKATGFLSRDLSRGAFGTFSEPLGDQSGYYLTSDYKISGGQVLFGYRLSPNYAGIAQIDHPERAAMSIRFVADN
jgi:uncharacterized protein (TIGR02145 family)